MRLAPRSLAVALVLTGLLAALAIIYVQDGAAPVATNSTPPAAPAPLLNGLPPGRALPALPTPQPDLAAAVLANATDLPSLVTGNLDPQTPAEVRAWANDLLGEDADGRANAIHELGFLDDPRWLPVVIWVLAHDPAAPVRSAAAAALATQRSSPTAAHALTAALSDADPEVRDDALLSLKALRNPTVESDLRRLLSGHQLDPETERAVRLLLDRLYTRIDPFADPLAK